MSFDNSLRKLVKSHGWDTKSSKPLLSNVASSSEPIIASVNIDAADKSNTQRVDDFYASCEVDEILTAPTDSCDFTIFNENFSNASELVSTTHTPSFVRTIHKSSRDSLLPPVLFDSKSKLTTPLDSDTKINTNNTPFNKSIHHKMEQQASMKSSTPRAPLPPDCIDKIYLEEGLSKNTVSHHVLEK